MCDKIQYCAGDYVKFGGKKKSGFESYIKQLENWCNSEFSHPKARAVLEYVKKKNLVKDLVSLKILELNNAVLITIKKDSKEKIEKSSIFAVIQAELILDQGDAFVRWRIESDNDLVSGTFGSTF